MSEESQDKEAVESSPKLPGVIDPTVAAGSIRSQREPLLKLIRYCLSSLANSLLAKSIIPQDVYEKVCNQHLEKSERGGALLDCVETRIRLKASCFVTFIDVLKSNLFLSDLAELLIQSYYYTLSLMPPANHPATISPAFSQYTAYLKGVYRNSPVSPDSKWPPTPSKKYIKLATVEHGHKCRDEFIGDILHGNIKDVLKSRKEIFIDEILLPDVNMNYLKLILVEGAPGIGKSTLAWELCRRWEQGCTEKYSLTVLLRLREKEVQEISSIAELFHSCPSKYKDVLLDEISSSNGKGVLFILDGFDELPTTLQKEGFLVNLIRGTLLPETTVLVTSRPLATAKLLTICRPQIQKRIEILGFTQESVDQYATSIFLSEPERLKFKAFVSASNNPAINSLMYVPLNAAIIVEIYRHSKSDHLLPHTLTQVYTQLCLTILNRYLQSSNSPSVGVNSFRDLPDHLFEEFLKLAEVAFTAMKRQEVTFHTLPSDLVHFGFLDAISSLYGGGSASYNFLHLTLQEFLAAYHISQLCGDARLALLKECCNNSRWNVVWRFVAGLTEFKFFEGHLNSPLFVEGSRDGEVDVKLLFTQCLFEANIKIDSSKLFELKVSFLQLPPLDFYTLGYCIANLTGDLSWNITLKSINSIDGLTNGLKTNSNISNNKNVKKLSIACPLKQVDLKHFPLHGITDLHLLQANVSDLCKLLPLMTSLKRLCIPSGTCQCGNEFLRQLYQTNVTSLNIQDTEDIARCVSALQPLIDPLTGTLEELSVSGSKVDESLLDVVCAPSSLKSLKLSNPHNISSLTQLQTNTRLTKLDISFSQVAVNVIAEVTVGILEHNKTLEHLIMECFRFPEDIDAIKNVARAVHGNGTLKSLKISIVNILRMGAADYLQKYAELNEPRISFHYIHHR